MTDMTDDPQPREIHCDACEKVAIISASQPAKPDGWIYWHGHTLCPVCSEPVRDSSSYQLDQANAHLRELGMHIRQTFEPVLIRAIEAITRLLERLRRLTEKQ